MKVEHQAVDAFPTLQAMGFADPRFSRYAVSNVEAQADALVKVMLAIVYDFS